MRTSTRSATVDRRRSRQSRWVRVAHGETCRRLRTHSIQQAVFGQLVGRYNGSHIGGIIQVHHSGTHLSWRFLKNEELKVPTARVLFRSAIYCTTFAGSLTILRRGCPQCENRFSGWYGLVAWKWHMPRMWVDCSVMVISINNSSNRPLARSRIHRIGPSPAPHDRLPPDREWGVEEVWKESTASVRPQGTRCQF